MQWQTSIDSIPNIPSSCRYPFTSRPFLQVLEETGCLGNQSGWQPNYLTGQNSPWYLSAFLKQHSYGEYVFDWSWAEAYQRHGLQYYPKLVVAAPFTPATGKRLHTIGELSDQQAKDIQRIIQASCIENQWSSLHYLFPSESELLLFNQGEWLLRKGVQFHWFNRDYQSFDHYLSHFKSRKRKDIRKERDSLNAQNIQVRRLIGSQIQPEDIQFFYQCYQLTYLKRGMSGYLSLQAFLKLLNVLGDQMLLVKATHNDAPIACALYFFDDHSLYGRYWGCHQEVANLHFEACYYQGIEFCIERGLQHFDPGTQGEHKIRRGFEPILTHSLHWMTRPDFHKAIAQFLNEETPYVEQYQQECHRELPFNSEHLPPLRLGKT